MKNKMLIFDLDGTLFDTKEINYRSYLEAFKEAGFEVEIDYDYYCQNCNGRSYKTFVPEILPGVALDDMFKIHELKKNNYKNNIGYAKINEMLFSLIDAACDKCIIAIVTTASYKNTMDILDYYNVAHYFDLIISGDDVSNNKPEPDGYLLAINTVGLKRNECLIFEDSDVGLRAAEASGIPYVKVYGYN